MKVDIFRNLRGTFTERKLWFSVLMSAFFYPIGLLYMMKIDRLSMSRAVFYLITVSITFFMLLKTQIEIPETLKIVNIVGVGLCLGYGLCDDCDKKIPLILRFCMRACVLLLLSIPLLAMPVALIFLLQHPQLLDESPIRTLGIVETVVLCSSSLLTLGLAVFDLSQGCWMRANRN